jgi:sugar phosphate isomerase/epimerase
MDRQFFVAVVSEPIILWSSPRTNSKPADIVAKSVGSRMNRIGVHSHLFRGSPSAVAACMRDHGLTCVQLTPSFPHLHFDEPGQVTADRCQRATEPFLESDLEIVALSGGENLLAPDVDRRHPAIVRLHALIRHSRDFCTGRVVLNLGHWESPDSSDSISPEPVQSSEIGCIIAEALRVAEDHGVELLLKSDRCRISSWRASIRCILSEVPSSNVRFVMDPANYLANSLSEHLAYDVRRLCEELGPLAPLVHAKDLCFCSGGITSPRAGRGSFDYAAFFQAYHLYQPEAPVILEHLRPAEVDETRAYMESCLGKTAPPGPQGIHECSRDSQVGGTR